jgi:hypothetical protein
MKGQKGINMEDREIAARTLKFEDQWMVGERCGVT